MIPKRVLKLIPQTAALEVADRLRLAANQHITEDRRFDLAQFMTPAPVARLMASMFTLPAESIRLLDPGAAVGSLTAAFIDEVCARRSRPSAIEVTAFEIDARLATQLEHTLSVCREVCASRSIRFSSTVIVGDFIEAMASRFADAAFAGTKQRFTHVITNPPYRKIRSDSSTRRLLARAGIETTNLYAAFMALAVMAMAPGGEFVSITPRSFCNGPYFKPFRQAFLRSMTLSRFHLFHSRKTAFRGDDVLQENIITYAVRAAHKSPPPVVISSSESPTDPMSANRLAPYADVVRPADPDSFIHLVVDEENALVASRMRALKADLIELGLEVSTGRVVDFRACEHLRAEPGPETVPLIYPCNMQLGRIEWPKPAQKKPQAIARVASTEKLLVDAGYYVLVKRFSAKEERRRVVAAVFDPADASSERVGFENHLNYFHSRGRGLPLALAHGMAAFLNSTNVDKFFRQFNGHTQVNASDLRKLHYPTASQLEAIGKAVIRQRCHSSATDVDQIVSSILGWLDSD